MGQIQFTVAYTAILDKETKVKLKKRENRTFLSALMSNIQS